MNGVQICLWMILLFLDSFICLRIGRQHGFHDATMDFIKKIDVMHKEWRAESDMSNDIFESEMKKEKSRYTKLCDNYAEDHDHSGLLED